MMNTQRMYEKIAGIAFFTATLGYGIGNSILQQAFELLKSSAPINATNVGLGIGLELVNSLSVIVIGYMLYSRLKLFMPALMKGYFVLRTVEALLLGFGSLKTLSILITPNIQALEVASLIESRLLLFSLAMLCLSVVSVAFLYQVYKKALLPPAMSILGIVGYAGTALYGLVGLLNHGQANMMLFAIGGVFEIIFPIYLIAKGFNQTNTSTVSK